jgi:hypothetical protein
MNRMTTTKQAQVEAGPSKPAYQHRHRPDQPPPAGAAARPPGAEVKRPFNRVASSEDAAARRLQAIMGDSAPPPIVAGNANPQPSSGGSSTTLTEGVKPRGGFNPQLAVSWISLDGLRFELISRNPQQFRIPTHNQLEP